MMSGEQAAPSQRQILEVYEAEFAKTLKDFGKQNALALGAQAPETSSGDEQTPAGETSEEKPAMLRRKDCVRRIRRVLAKSQKFYLKKVELYKWTKAGLDCGVEIEKVQLEIESERQRIRQLLKKTAPESVLGGRSQQPVDLEFLDGEELDRHLRTKEQQERLSMEIRQLLADFADVQRQISDARDRHEGKVDELRKEVGIGFGNDCHQLEKGADAAENSSQKIWAMERQLIRTTQDYLGLRHNTSVLERNLMEEVTDAQVAEEELRETAHDCAMQVKREIDEADRNISDTVESSMRRIKDLVCAKRMERVQLMEQQDQATPIYARELKIAEKEARLLRRKLRRERGRHRMDLEGFGRDIENLRVDLQQLIRMLAMEEAAAPIRRSILAEV